MGLDLDVDPEDLQLWLQEAEEHLQLLDQELIRLERDADDQELLQAIFRAAHTLKGASAAINHTRMAELTHVMESVLDDLRGGSLGVSSELIDALLAALDSLRLLRDEVVSGEINPDVDVATLASRLESIRGGSAPSADPEAAVPPAAADAGPEPAIGFEFELNPAELDRARTLEVKGKTAFALHVTLSAKSPMPAARCLQVLATVGELGVVLASHPTPEQIMAEQVGTDLHVLVASDADALTLANAAKTVLDIEDVSAGHYFDEREPAIAAEPRDTDRSTLVPDQGDRRRIDLGPEARNKSDADQLRLAGSKMQKLTQTVRIDVERLDNLMNLVGELVIDKTRLQQLAADLNTHLPGNASVASLDQAANHVGLVTDELQEEVMRSRMLPIETVFNKIPRIVRDLARNMGKEINFVVEGKETELDRSVIEEIGDPLIHAIRNAVDHGIEPPDERETLEKPREGTLLLSARHEENQIVISISDDGAGIDSGKLIRKAVESGQLTEEAAGRLTDAEATDLVFTSGLSTATKVTDVSGRGVGMDIVRTNIEKLNGTVAVTSTTGRGTVVTIRLPLTLAIVRALLVQLREQVFAIPLSAVMESLERTSSEIFTAQGHEVIRVRDEVLPLVRLTQFFSMTGANGQVASVDLPSGSGDAALAAQAGKPAEPGRRFRRGWRRTCRPGSHHAGRRRRRQHHHAGGRRQGRRAALGLRGRSAHRRAGRGHQIARCFHRRSRRRRRGHDPRRRAGRHDLGR